MSKPVVFVTGRNPAQGKGGGSAYVRAHMRAARRAGYEPHVFCIDAREGVSEEDFGIVHGVVPAWPFRPALKAVANGKPQGFLGAWFGAFAFSPYNALAHAPRLTAAVERFLSGRPGPHLVHGFYTWACVGLEVRARLRRQSIECAVIDSVYTTARHEAQGKASGVARGPVLHRAVFRAERLWIDRVVRRQERRAYKQSRLVLLNYESVRKILASEHGAASDVRKAPYSPETAFTRERAAPRHAPAQSSEAPLIVSVSRHDPRKGLEFLLRALARLLAEGVRFRACLVSGGPLLAAHRRLAQRLGLADLVTFTGWVADPAPYLERADVFVLPSLEEGSGSMSLLEALQGGLAIVASNVDGISEDVTDGDNALLVPPGDAGALAAALKRALADPALRAGLGRRARSTFERRFTAEAFSAALGSLYAELGVVNGSGGNPA